MFSSSKAPAAIEGGPSTSASARSAVHHKNFGSDMKSKKDFEEENGHSRRILASLSAGAAAGALAKTVIAPFDRTKIYFQTHPEKRYRIRGAVKFLKLTYQNEGFLRLWRGNTATMARIVPYAAIQFSSHEQYKRIFGIDAASVRSGVKRPAYLHFIAGSMAGVTGQAMTYPLDRARAVMAVTRIGEYRNLIDVFRRIVAQEGVMALYRGFVPTIVGVVPYAGVSFFTFETLKKMWTQRAMEVRPDSPNPSPIERMLSGACAGLLGQTASYPLDIVRRRMQTAVQMGAQKNLYSSVLGTLIYVLRREGLFRGWYKGISMNFIKGPLAVGTSFTTYDYLHTGFLRLLRVE